MQGHDLPMGRLINPTGQETMNECVEDSPVVAALALSVSSATQTSSTLSATVNMLVFNGRISFPMSSILIGSHLKKEIKKCCYKEGDKRRFSIIASGFPKKQRLGVCKLGHELKINLHNFDSDDMSYTHWSILS